MGPHLPDRLSHRSPMASATRAMVSPSGGIVAVAAGALAALAGLGLPGVVLVALAAWMVRVAVAAIPRPARRPPAPDPFGVSEPWRSYVMAALRHQRRFTEACSTLEAGPLRERLRSMEDRVGEATADIWSIARDGHQLTRARQALGSGRSPTVSAADPGDAAARIDAAIEATRRRLDDIDNQLGAVVARTIEVAATAGTGDDATGTAAGLTELNDEIEALRLALGDLGTTDGDQP